MGPELGLSLDLMGLLPSDLRAYAYYISPVSAPSLVQSLGLFRWVRERRSTEATGYIRAYIESEILTRPHVRFVKMCSGMRGEVVGHHHLGAMGSGTYGRIWPSSEFIQKPMLV